MVAWQRWQGQKPWEMFMSSPFPGMDPYLEGSHWMGVHSQLSAEITRQLTPLLVPKYLALTNERFVLEIPEDIGSNRKWLADDNQTTKVFVPFRLTAPLYW
jgi:Protein of unknown function (DUF4058)